MVSGDVFDDFFRTLEVTLQEIPLVIQDDEAGTVREITYRCGALDLDVEDASESEEGMRTVMAEVRSASGHRFHAILDIHFKDSGEHWGTRLVVPGPAVGQISVLQQGTPQFTWWYESAEENLDDFKLAPYRYRYLDESRYERDHHIGDDGWSLL